jgi:exodeoxyribonuclease VII large subunit
MTATLERRRQRLARLSAQLDALSPLRVLQRGYAVPTGPEGRVLKHRSEFIPGEPFTLRVADGSVAARVEPR